MTILEYGSHPRRRWIRWVAIALLILLSVAVYFAVVSPRIKAHLAAREADRRRAAQRDQFARLMNPHTAKLALVAANDRALKADPTILDSFGPIHSYRQIPPQQINDQTWQIRPYANDGWYNLYALYSFEIGGNIEVAARVSPNGKPYFVAIDYTINGHLIEFHGTALDLTKPGVEMSAWSSGRNSPNTVKLGQMVHFDDTCVIYRGITDPANPASISFDIVHGKQKEHVKVDLLSSGALQLSPADNSENRWQVSTPKR